jgi:hypothetical protein
LAPSDEHDRTLTHGNRAFLCGRFRGRLLCRRLLVGMVPAQSGASPFDV